ncbi:hypothetical protein [Carp edema virus]|nr:hypothetical protein [Carp edema virus]
MSTVAIAIKITRKNESRIMAQLEESKNFIGSDSVIIKSVKNEKLKSVFRCELVSNGLLTPIFLRSNPVLNELLKKFPFDDCLGYWVIDLDPLASLFICYPKELDREKFFKDKACIRNMEFVRQLNIDEFVKLKDPTDLLLEKIEFASMERISSALDKYKFFNKDTTTRTKAVPGTIDEKIFKMVTDLCSRDSLKKLFGLPQILPYIRSLYSMFREEMYISNHVFATTCKLLTFADLGSVNKLNYFYDDAGVINADLATFSHVQKKVKYDWL